MASSVPYDHLVKIILVGDSGVGKSAFLERLAQNSFTDAYQHTIGVDFRLYPLTMEDGKSVKLQIWDTAGQERYRTIISGYYRGSHGILLLFDVSDLSSFDSIQNWLKEIRVHSTKDIPIFLVGAKADLQAKRKVTREEAQALAEDLDLAYLECSSKLQESESLRDTLIRPFVSTILKSPVYTASQRPKAPAIRVTNPEPQKAKKKKSSWCC